MDGEGAAVVGAPAHQPSPHSGLLQLPQLSWLLLRTPPGARGLQRGHLEVPAPHCCSFADPVTANLEGAVTFEAPDLPEETLMEVRAGAGARLASSLGRAGHGAVEVRCSAAPSP